MRKILPWIFSGRGLLWLLLVWASMLLIVLSGLFHLVAPNTWQVLQSMPSKALAVCCALSALGVLLRIIKSGRQRGALYKWGQVIYLLSVIILSAALWVSAYTHFEGDLVRSEGESFNAFPTEYLKESMHFSSRQSLPQVGMTFTKIRPAGTNAGLETVGADVLYAGRTTDRVLQGTLSSSGYFVSDWTLARIVDFGYAVRFSLMGLDERELESAMLPLKTYPPGAEDKFETTFPGYQFYIKVYPDHVEQEGALSSKTVNLSNPAIRLRITRNKDIVYDDVITLENKVRFDNLVIAFPSLAYWVKVRMVRDLGIPVAAAGMLFMCVGVALLVVGRARDLSGPSSIQY